MNAAEQRAREFLAQGKWRKARDELKPLVKADRPRYLPLLIEANVGLAREMIAKGQTEEARQVLTYLATLAPGQQLVGLQCEVAARSGKAADFTAKFAAALADESGGMSAKERSRLADQLVLTFSPLPDQPRLSAELRAVHEALEATARQEWPRVAEILREVPHRSPFSHWALFIKGVAAFHGGDTERALRFFSGLPQDSVPAKASQAYRLLAGQPAPVTGNRGLSEAILDGACHLAGLAGIGRLLLRADEFWREGRYADSYRVFRDNVAQFPTDSLDWIGTLTDFYFQAPHAMAEAQRDKFIEYLDGVLGRDAAKNPIEKMQMLRLFSLAEGRMIGSWDLRTDWEGFIHARQQFYKPNPRLDSMAYAWLGEELSLVRSNPYYGQGNSRSELRDPQGACSSLEKAIELDPQNLRAHLALAMVYEALNRTSDRNRLLDEMARRFPEEKPVLLENARGCLEREAFNKALSLLERARHLDRLDPQIPELIVVARRRLARQQYAQQHLEKARQTLAPIDEFLTDKPGDLQRSRWTALLRQGLMEQLFGDPKAGVSLVQQARAQSPFPAALLFFGHLAHRAYSNPNRTDSPFLNELRAELKRTASTTDAVLLIRILQYWDGSPEKPPVADEAGMLRAYLKAAVKRPFTRAEAKALVEVCPPDRFREQTASFVKAMLKKDPGDPFFRLFDLLLKSPWEYDPDERREKLNAILQEASRRGDHELSQKVQGMLRSLNHPPPLPVIGEPDDFDDDEDDFDTEDDFDPGPVGAPLPGSSAAETAEFAEIMELIANASEAELRQLRKRRPKGMPDFVFDMMVAAAKGIGPSPGAFKPLIKMAQPKPPQPKPAPAEDPRQGNLF